MPIGLKMYFSQMGSEVPFLILYMKYFSNATFAR